MARKQQIQKGAGGTLFIEAPARPSAATVSIYDPLGRIVLTSAAATVDTATTTVSVAWTSAAPTTLTLTSVAGFAVNRSYELLLADGQSHSIRIIGINSTAKTVTLQDVPSITPVIGSTVQSRRVAYAVASTLLTDYGEGYRCQWTFTIASQAVTAEQIFDCVHTPARNPATAAGMRRYKPTLTNLWDQVTRTHPWDDVINAAFDRVAKDFETQLMEAQHSLCYAMVDWDQVEDVVYERVLLDNCDTLIPKDYSGFQESWRTLRVDCYHDAMDRFTRGIRYIDPNQDRTKPVQAENRSTRVRFG